MQGLKIYLYYAVLIHESIPVYTNEHAEYSIHEYLEPQVLNIKETYYY